jgi:hypothetical protein
VHTRSSPEGPAPGASSEAQGRHGKRKAEPPPPASSQAPLSLEDERAAARAKKASAGTQWDAAKAWDGKHWDGKPSLASVEREAKLRALALGRMSAGAEGSSFQSLSRSLPETARNYETVNETDLAHDLAARRAQPHRDPRGAHREELRQKRAARTGWGRDGRSMGGLPARQSRNQHPG